MTSQVLPPSCEQIPTVDKNIKISPDKMVLPHYKQQKSEIQSLLNQKLQVGQSWYLIHIRWYKQWKKYVGYDNWDRASAGDEIVKPGPIDNTSLLEFGKLRRQLNDEVDYKLVPEEAWNNLLTWYGITEESNEIKRYVVELGLFVKQLKVEIYPLELKASVYPRESEFRIVTISRCDTIHTLVRKIREVYNIQSDKQTRIYNRYMAYPYELIQDLFQEARGVGLFNGQWVLLEVQNEDGSWPRPVSLSTKSKQSLL